MRRAREGTEGNEKREGEGEGGGDEGVGKLRVGGFCCTLYGNAGRVALLFYHHGNACTTRVPAGPTREGVRTFHLLAIRAGAICGTDDFQLFSALVAHGPRRKTLAALVRAPSATRPHTRALPPARDAYRAPHQSRRLAHTPARTASSRRARATDVSSLVGARNLLAAAAVPCRVR